MRQIIATTAEIQTELENIQTCPAPCEDGTVLISPSAGNPQRRRCPLLSFACAYGSGLEEKLDGYLNRLILNAGVPIRHVGHFDAYIETPALLWADKWGFGGFLVFAGKSGVGKSFGAAWAAKRYLRNKIPNPLDTKTWSRAAREGEKTVWATANSIVRDKNAILSACASCLLVMDDFGREGDFPTRRADAGDIVSARYDARLPTIVTTELTFEEIIAVYGHNTAFKLTEDVQGESAGGMIVDCGDVSLRQELDDGFGFGESGALWERGK